MIVANKGETKSEKRLATSRAVWLNRKASTFTARSKPGPHDRQNSVALAVLLRDLLGVTKNARETRFLLGQESVKVDGKVRRDERFPVGLFDIVAVGDKAYRILLDSKGRLKAKAVGREEKSKICKIVGKKSVANGLIQLETNDGRTFRDKSFDLKVGDSIVIGLPDAKIVEALPLKEGSLAYISSGRRVATLAEIKQIIAGTMKRPKLVVLKPAGANEFQTVEKNVFVVGKRKAAIEVKE